jgi:hypothetical protein
MSKYGATPTVPLAVIGQLQYRDDVVSVFIKRHKVARGLAGAHDNAT